MVERRDTGAQGHLSVTLHAPRPGGLLAKKNWDSGNQDDDGKHSPRGNQAENKQFNDALRTVERDLGRKVTPAERRSLHDRITGQGCDYHRVVDKAKGLFDGC
ncbi:hypothetical protein [Streptomyces sp. TRM49041]|uniref:hypothetical protein n=1 Tax=Streptomyces sp. TRM49041 TaxID=2603216 RepID=UPI0011EC73BE|nr:hypothetical protein [Streptomyces sp. TRM49041]